jgi:hypothetical protein
MARVVLEGSEIVVCLSSFENWPHATVKYQFPSPLCIRPTSSPTGGS